MKVFISYSHQDEEYLERLHTHLEFLKSEGLIEVWHDRDILAGSNIDEEVKKNLEKCNLFLCLLSPDFLASAYCREEEMTTALKKYDEGKVQVVPIILRPCDWRNTQLKNLKAIPKDGRAISDYGDPDTAFMEIVDELRRVIAENSQTVPKPKNIDKTEAKLSKYKIKRDFNSVDHHKFLDKSFSEIMGCFEAFVAELDNVLEIDVQFKKINENRFNCLMTSRASNSVAAISVFIRYNGTNYGSIAYSESLDSDSNSYNGWITVETDEYELYLSYFDFWMHTYSDGKDEKLTSQEIAKRLWDSFLRRGGVSYNDS